MSNTELIQLSIIVPVYNGEKYIVRLFDRLTVLNKGNIEYEIILIDDGSKDKSCAICQKLTQENEHVIYHRKTNGGIASARNVGLDLARGKYVTFADQDDDVLFGYSEFIDRCEAEKLDFIVTAPYSKKVGEVSPVLRPFRDETLTNKLDILPIAGKLISGSYLSNPTAQFISTTVWNVIYNREFLQRNGIHFKVFIDYEDDWIFNIETLVNAERIAITSKGYYCWMIRGGSESHRAKYIQNLPKKRKAWIQWLERIIDVLEVDSKVKKDFIDNVIIPRSIMMCFNNACWEPTNRRDAVLSEIQTIIAPEQWNIRAVKYKQVKEMDTTDKLLLWLLKNVGIMFAYYINTFFIKKRFH